MSSEQRSAGLLFVVSAPSGTGKTTVVERLVQIFPISGCRGPTPPARCVPGKRTAWTIISLPASASRR
jgi:hypothetical protein